MFNTNLRANRSLEASNCIDQNVMAAAPPEPDDCAFADTAISHELRTPLTAIQAALGLLQSGRVHLESDRGQRLLEIATNNTQRLVRSVTTLEADALMLGRTMPVADLHRLRLETELYAAWEHQEFAVFYQPIVCTRTQRIVSLEALLRWRHPQRGWISPDVFIPVAEELGLISPLGEWVLGQACRQLRLWQEQFPAFQPLAVSVNLSPFQLGQVDLIDQVRRILRRTGIAPRSLQIEITESALIDDSAQAIAMLRQLKALGVQIYLDDFGTGYSSLSRLHELTADVLKIDRTFVLQQQWSLICGILSLAAGLGLGVVIEGIETAAELERAQNLGCHRYQGYYFSRPVDAENATRLLDDYNGSTATTAVLPEPMAAADLLAAEC